MGGTNKKNLSSVLMLLLRGISLFSGKYKAIVDGWMENWVDGDMGNAPRRPADSGVVRKRAEI
jgi:hypothetical protein